MTYESRNKVDKGLRYGHDWFWDELGIDTTRGIIPSEGEIRTRPFEQSYYCLPRHIANLEDPMQHVIQRFWRTRIPER